MFENITKFLKKFNKGELKMSSASKDAAKERLHLVLMQDRANVSVDFLELMKQEIIDVIKKYIEVDETAIDVRLTHKDNGDGTNGAPALYANIPILNIKNEARKIESQGKHMYTGEEEIYQNKNIEDNNNYDEENQISEGNEEIDIKENIETAEEDKEEKNEIENTENNIEDEKEIEIAEEDTEIKNDIEILENSVKFEKEAKTTGEDEEEKDAIEDIENDVEPEKEIETAGEDEEEKDEIEETENNAEIKKIKMKQKKRLNQKIN